MVRGRRRLLAPVVVLAALWLPLLADAAGAHPLGNFTVNRYVRVEVAGDTLRVHYVLDQAEVPTVADIDAVRADPRGWAERRVEAIREGLALEVDGRHVPLHHDEHLLSQPAGEGGLPTLRLAARFAAALPQGPPDAVRRAVVTDHNEPDRLGWRELLVVASGDARLLRSDAPDSDVADELREYPEELIDQPLDRREAAFSFRLGGDTVEPAPLRRPGDAAPVGSGAGLAGLLATAAPGGWAVASLLLAGIGFGAVHAAGPGHGKTVMAAFLVGTRGRPRDAVALGALVSLMHTASVLLLGAGILTLGRFGAPEQTFPWLSLASGVAVAGVGAHLCRLRFAGGTHGSGQGHGHDHAPPAEYAPLSWRGLAALASSGGLFPSPSALLVLLAAVSIGRLGLGLAVIAAFSLGLAVTLSAAGLSLVYGRSVVERTGHGRRALFLAPRISAVALVVLGALVATGGAATLLG